MDATPATHEWGVDTTAPTSTINARPAALSNSPSATFAFAGSEPGSFACSLDGALAAPCTSPVSYNLLTDGSHTFTVAATDLAGNVGASPASASWVVDTIAPASTISEQPAALSSSPSASFAFNSDEAGSSFECRLDGAAFVPCGGSASYNELGEGSHTFEVQATDAAGNTETTPASYSWTVDSSAPDTTLLDVPAAQSNSASATFTFSGSEEGGTFACQLDDAAFAPCTSPQSVSGLGEGSHTFSVQATDAAGNPDPSPASHSWTVDSVAPETTITGQPATLSNSGSASFSFASSEEGSSFACSLDGASSGACTAPLSYSDLPDGSHTFEVVATDSVGNSDPTAASYSWTIDTEPGDTVIDSAPPVLTNSASATFAFSAEPGSMFQCQVDGGSFAVCTSPKSYSGLADGTHTFAVRATDIAGNVDPTPASHAWTIDTTLPTTSIVGQPAALSNSPSASFTFASNEPGSFACSLDSGPFAACTSPATYNALAEGSHSFAVRATDAAGNVGLAASASWVVDTVAPTLTITSGPASPTSQTSATFAFASSEAGSSVTCKVDSGAFAPCSSPVTFSGLAVGNHSFTLQGSDAAGNSGAPVSYAWTVVVAYHFTGFYQPISNLPALNSVKGGSSVPVKFSLGGNQGLDVFAAGYPRSQVIACGSTVPVDGGEATNTPGSSGLTYDAASNSYSYVWKTEKTWANSCRQLIVRFNDGTLYRANFSFK